MKKIVLLVCVLLLFQTAFSQSTTDTLKTQKDSMRVAPSPANVRKDNRPLKERLDFGFGLSFWITPNQTYAEMAPVLAYRFPKALIAGMGYRYIYRHSRVYGKDLNAYGPDFFVRLNATKRIYLWTEYEILQNEYFSQATGQELTKDKTTTESWFGGIGYIKSVGKRGRGGISMQILYNFLYTNDDINPYYSPVTYRVGYFF